MADAGHLTTELIILVEYEMSELVDERHNFLDWIFEKW